MKLLKYLTLTLLLLSTACSQQKSEVVEPQIEFYAPIQTTVDNEVEIALQLTSTNSDFEADSDFAARMKLFEENGDLRAEAVMEQNPFMKEGEIYQIMTWKGYLDPGEYTLDWSAPQHGGTKITFEVYELDSGQFSIGDQTIIMISPD